MLNEPRVQAVIITEEERYEQDKASAEGYGFVLFVSAVLAFLTTTNIIDF